MRPATASLPGVLLLAVLAFACSGATPTAPTGNGSPGGVATLTAGSYFLTLSAATTTVTGSDGHTFQTQLCMSLNGGAPTSGRFLVTLEPSSNTWVARAVTGTLTLAFKIDGGSATGPISGGATSVDGNVKVDVSGTAAGSVNAPDVLFGDLTGRADFSTTGGSSGCSANTWKLSRD